MPRDIAVLGLDKLSVQERLEVIEIIWASLPVQVEATELPNCHLAELEKRRADAYANPGVGKPWREVLDRLEAKS